MGHVGHFDKGLASQKSLYVCSKVLLHWKNSPGKTAVARDVVRLIIFSGVRVVLELASEFWPLLLLLLLMENEFWKMCFPFKMCPIIHQTYFAIEKEWVRLVRSAITSSSSSEKQGPNQLQTICKYLTSFSW